MKLLVDNLLYYMKIIKQIVKNSVSKEINSRGNFFIRIATDLLWYIVNVVFFEIIYMKMWE